MFLVDANVLIDVLTENPAWGEWSRKALSSAGDRGELAINPILYAEIACGFASMAELDLRLDAGLIRRLPLPNEAGFIAGRAFLEYRRRGGSRRSPLPDFYIGAHACVSGLILLTRDARRYRSYFPKLRLIAPDEG